ncbi:MAG: PIG-L deacetylase family protein [Clostridiales bacterium]|nr:PIG-L deacetylase family protein [Clostridiales bacterium]
MSGEKVLFIGSHPDDIDLGCAICMHDHYLKNDRIKTMVLTRGEKGNGNVNSNRVLEECKSFKILAPEAENIFFDFPDTMLFHHMNEIIEEIKNAVIGDVPDVVYIPSIHDFHQDHVVTYECAMAVFNSVKIRKIICYETPSTMPGFSPNYFKVCDLDNFGIKVKAIKCHESQADKPYVDYETIYSIAKMRANQGRYHEGVAEAFEIIRFSEMVL